MVIDANHIQEAEHSEPEAIIQEVQPSEKKS
jgi:hypothetical protein